jgi:type VI protein secretion system component VasF
MFFALIRFSQQARSGKTGAPENIRREMLTALREGAEIAAQDSAADRAWHERIRKLLIYFCDYRLSQTDWPGRAYWLNHRLETSPDGLAQPTGLGGDRFFDDCDELQKSYERVEHRDREDRGIMAEQLSLYYTAIRLGFRGRYHDFPVELEEYSRRLFALIPGQKTLGDDPMFPQAYDHTIKKPAIYALGVSVARIAAIFLVLLVAIIVVYQVAWRNAIRVIRESAETYESAALIGDGRPSGWVPDGLPPPCFAAAAQRQPMETEVFS